MAADVTAGPGAQARRARIAVAAVFLTNGALFANIVPRYPQIKESLGLSNAALGTALAAGALGSLLGGLFAAVAIRRFRSSRTGAAGMLLMAAAFLLVAVAPAGWVLAAVFLVAGAADAIVDVAQNAHGLRVQRRYGRSIVNSFHGVWRHRRGARRAHGLGRGRAAGAAGGAPRRGGCCSTAHDCTWAAAWPYLPLSPSSNRTMCANPALISAASALCSA